MLIKEDKTWGNMTKCTENFQHGCKNKENNLFLFIAGRREVTQVEKIFKKHFSNCKENWALE